MSPPPVMADMTWKEIKDIKTNNKTTKVIIPVGSIEQHGPHLPINTDTLIAQKISQLIGKKINALVTPVIQFGVSKEHMDFPGTISLSNGTLVEIIGDISNSLNKHGFNEQIIINSHGGNTKTLAQIKGTKLISVLGRFDKFDHAGEIETSVMLFLFPKKVRINEIKVFDYEIPGADTDDWKTIDHSKSGVIGDAKKASAKKGKEYFDQIIDGILKEIE